MKGNKGALLSPEFVDFIKHRKNLLLIIIAVLGCVILFASVLGATDETEEGSEDALSEYKSALEGELSELLSRVSGAGRCVVRVTFSEGERLEYKGSVVIGRRPPQVEGVTVLCEGGGRDAVRREISEVISALYGIGHNRICVLKLS